MKIDLFPKPGEIEGIADITKSLRNDFANSKQFNGAIAFYTINHSILGINAESVLYNPKSFICVDIHIPTDIDKLELLHNSGCNVYLHIFHLDGVKNVKHLMHTKLLYFESNENCTIWNGSHNWTNQALFGPNIESSTRVETTINDPFAVDVRAYLEMIKSICEPFEPRNIPIYKMLQKMLIDTGEGGINAMCAHLEVESVDELMRDNETRVIHCLSLDNNEYNVFKTVGGKIYFIIHEITTNETYLAESEITDVGKIIPNNPQTYNKVIPSRYYFFRGIAEDMSHLEGPSIINNEQLKSLDYHVELRILDYAKDYQLMKALTPTQQKNIIWEEDQNTLHSIRMRGNVNTQNLKIKRKSEHAESLINEARELNTFAGKKLSIDYNLLIEKFEEIRDGNTSKPFDELASFIREEKG